jgi:hypothetical protein
MTNQKIGYFLNDYLGDVTAQIENPAFYGTQNVGMVDSAPSLKCY